MTSFALAAVALFLGASPAPSVKVTANFSVAPKVEEQKFPFVSDATGGVELTLTRQSVTSEDGTFLLVSLSLLPLAQAPAVKNLKPEEQEPIVASAILELQKQLSERVVRSVSGKIADRKPVTLPVGKGTALSGPTLDEGDQPNGSFIAHVVTSETPALYVVLAATRDDKASKDKANDFVKSMTVPPASGKR
ncbi:MAG: hypothetical protein K1X64_02980 [Myxococcaceae bacterium]|nr:hypothetical protein [Myxococcaceae bacterium]